MGESGFSLGLPDLAATQKLGENLVKSSPGGGLVALTGDLGAGKTSLVRACLGELGESGPVRSPTYTLLETYQPSGVSVHHLDLYRLSSDDDISDLDLRGLLQGAWCFVEWPDRVPLGLEFDVTVSLDFQEQGRLVYIEAHTSHGRRWLDALQELN